MLPYPVPVLNGYRITHEELRQLHGVMRQSISSVTAERCLDGPRLLSPERGEGYTLKVHGRDLDGNLLCSVTIRMPWSGAAYVRRVRFVKRRTLKDS